jgi:hypothetical protein
LPNIDIHCVHESPFKNPQKGLILLSIYRPANSGLLETYAKFSFGGKIGWFCETFHQPHMFGFSRGVDVTIMRNRN